METSPYILSHSLRNKLFRLGLAAVVLFTGDLAACEQVVAKVGGGVGAILGNSIALENFTQRSENDYHITDEGDMFDVF